MFSSEVMGKTQCGLDGVDGQGFTSPPPINSITHNETFQHNRFGNSCYNDAMLLSNKNSIFMYLRYDTDLLNP